MANLFEESDFSLFEQYQGKTLAEAPEGQSKLRAVYDKLGKVLDVLRRQGYHTEINRNPLTQAGRATMKYCSYHWSKVYPKDQTLFEGCEGKAFFVVGSTQDGIDIHIDSNSRNGFDSDSNVFAKAIKDKTWCQIWPKEASRFNCEELADKVDNYIQQNWIEFNEFSKVFGVQECMDELNRLEMDRFKTLLRGNCNIILTGAPGTGKTFLAKEIAKALGAADDACKLIQFHPSFDYTDFIEGLRPVKKGDNLGFERRDGVFKEFCKEAYKAGIKHLIAQEYQEVYKEINNGTLQAIPVGGGKTKMTFCNSNGQWGLTTGTVRANGTPGDVAYLPSIEKLIDSGLISKKGIESFDGSFRDIIGGNDTDCKYVLLYLLDRIAGREGSKTPPYVFIIDEINRGEISKIFGELFYSMDSGYRGKKGRVDTQYQNLVPENDVFYDGFFIPENVYIIGTMNDIDRSVESMDFAMRRRFAWKEISAESRQSMLDDPNAWGDKTPSPGIIDEIKIRMNNLNACIIDKYGDEELSSKERIGLTKAYQIGAAYFLKYVLYDNFEDLWANHLEGLLYEYLRGSTDIEAKMDRLHSAFNDTVAH